MGCLRRMVCSIVFHLFVLVCNSGAHLSRRQRMIMGARELGAVVSPPSGIGINCQRLNVTSEEAKAEVRR
jgi:hypothetical protein